MPAWRGDNLLAVMAKPISVDHRVDGPAAREFISPTAFEQAREALSKERTSSESGAVWTLAKSGEKMRLRVAKSREFPW
jgi:hypothetical protein